MMNKIDNSGQGLAKLGRNEDNYMAHVAQGEMVVPPIISAETRNRIEAEMRAAGLSPDEYTVGGGMSINPITGLPEFGWLKKKFKQVKKVVKKLAPIAAVIPGPWQGPAIIYNKGKAAINIAKGDGGLGDLMTVFAGGSQKVFGADGALKNLGKANFGAKSGFMDSLKGIGSVNGKFNPFKYGTNIAKQYKDDQKQGYFGLFSGGDQPVDYMSGGQDGQFIDANYQPGSSDIPSPEEMKYINENYTLTGESGLLADKNGKLFSPADVLEQVRGSQTQSSGFKDFLGGIFSGGGSDGVGNYGVLGDILGGATDKLGITNYGNDDRSSRGLGGGLGAAALAGLLGKVTYDSAKERMGGLAETPAVTMDSLGRYQLSKELGTGGTRGEFGLPAAQKALEFNMGGPVYGYQYGGPVNRQYFNQGGAAVKELDMRNGGESAGPGTGTSDDIPAMLSDGEFVMTAKATRGAGAFKLNKKKSGIELVQGGKASRKKGVQNMREIMDIFEAI